MKGHKWIGVLLLAAVIAVSVSGCSGCSNEPIPAESTPESSESSSSVPEDSSEEADKASSKEQDALTPSLGDAIGPDSDGTPQEGDGSSSESAPSSQQEDVPSATTPGSTSSAPPASSKQESTSSSSSTPSKQESSLSSSSTPSRQESPEYTSSQTQTTTEADLDQYAREVLELVNNERTSRGLKALEWASDYAAGTQTRAGEIVTKFSHTRPDGRAFYTVFGIEQNYYFGENIASGYATPQDVMTGWMNSKGHRANILNDTYEQLAVGVVNSGGRLYWVQIFYNGRSNGSSSSSAPSSGASSSSTPSDTTLDLSGYAQRVFELVNEQRVANGLSKLIWDSTIEQGTQARAKELTQHYGHDRPDGSEFWKIYGSVDPNNHHYSENIAYGQRTPEEVMTEWMNSEGHRANILSPDGYGVAVGVAQSGGTVYWVQNFTNSSYYTAQKNKALTTEQRKQLANEAFDAINNARAKKGLKPFKQRGDLTAAAQTRADEMLASYVGDTRPDGSSYKTAFQLADDPDANVGYYYCSTFSYGIDVFMEKFSVYKPLDDFMFNTYNDYIGVANAVNADGNMCWYVLFY